MSKPSASTANQPEPFIVLPTSSHTHTLILLTAPATTAPNSAPSSSQPAPPPKDTPSPPSSPAQNSSSPTPASGAQAPSPVINQWFDIASVEDPSHRRDTQVQGLVESAEHVRSIIARSWRRFQGGILCWGG
ncbi:hypothetical protein VC83_00644 [Pseudogymnoascus destructans]|uniref:Uncharacterized protein n=1 Tax=Pseudogymnoascus destructans TaxID=655981 RepID=A0A177AQ01_9PEZI|nr:uncharacterized protein VC83_00644 [Pseudogymnoascus destructans]OAF63481.1 hypothetical protein VC83_00644 [Pseudogymnoascus destructans]